MHRRNLIAVAPIIFPFLSVAADDSKVSGLWEFAGSEGDVAATKMFLELKRDGQAVTAKDLGTGKIFVGSINKGSLKFPLEMKSVSSAKYVNVMFEGTVQQGIINGRTDAEGLTQAWMATALTSLWLCSNHDPNHPAKTREDMQKLSGENKCAGWHRVSS